MYLLQAATDDDGITVDGGTILLVLLIVLVIVAIVYIVDRIRRP